MTEAQTGPGATTDYRPYDREEKLGPPPWSEHDPKVIEWEAAHGHDVRLQCQLDPDCLVLEAQMVAVIDAAREVVRRFAGMEFYEAQVVDDALQPLDAALTALDRS